MELEITVMFILWFNLTCQAFIYLLSLYYRPNCLMGLFLAWSTLPHHRGSFNHAQNKHVLISIQAVEDVGAYPFYVEFWSVFVFFSSKWAEFLHVVSDLIESRSPVFFSAGLCFVFELKHVQKTRRRFLRKRNLLFSWTMKSAKHPVATCFFAYVFTWKRSTNQQKKIQGCDFLLNRRPHAKIQLIWTKKKTDQNLT